MLIAYKPVIGEWYPAYQPIRKDEVILSRLRIGHARNTHSYLLNIEPQPECIPCQEPFTVKHILLDCIDLQLSRENYFRVTSMKDLFETVEVPKIIEFLKVQIMMSIWFVF